MTIENYQNITPDIAADAWVAPTALVIGRVKIGPSASIWPGAVLRGDLEPIEIGAGSNIQDNSVLHTIHDLPLRVGRDVTVGHGVILHSCTIGDRCLIGMGAIVLDGAVIGDDCLIGAGALVPEKKIIPSGSLVLGLPGKVVRPLTTEEKARIIRGAEEYRGFASHQQ